jgi:hypothetical protein
MFLFIGPPLWNNILAEWTGQEINTASNLGSAINQFAYLGRLLFSERLGFSA